MVLATAKIGDFDRFWNTFSTKGAEKRKQHGCKGSHVFRDPNESDRVWAIFDWDEAGWQSFTSDPQVPAIFQEAGFTQVRQVGGVPPSARRLERNPPSSGVISEHWPSRRPPPFARKLCCDVELVRLLGGPIRGVVDWRQRRRSVLRRACP